jgi:hypothetical protein
MIINRERRWVKRGKGRTACGRIKTPGDLSFGRLPCGAALFSKEGRGYASSFFATIGAVYYGGTHKCVPYEGGVRGFVL